MKIALFQMNPLVGDPQQNLKQLLEAAGKAAQAGADLLVSPELSICGYPPKDLLFRGDMIGQIQLALQHLAQKTPLPILVGAPLPTICLWAIRSRTVLFCAALRVFKPSRISS